MSDNSAIVICVLVFLMILTFFIRPKKNHSEAEAEDHSIPSQALPKVEIAPKIDLETAPVQIAAICPKTVAAIMAAVSMASGKPIEQLHFTAIRRGNTIANIWATSSTADIIASRQAYL